MQTFAPSPGTGDLTLNPNFVNPAQGNFALAAASPLIGAGQFGYDMGAVSYTVRPKNPTNLQILTQPNQFTAQLSWTNPTHNTDGSALASLGSVQVFRNDELITTLTGMTPGGAGQYTDTVPLQGNYRYKVVAVTSANGLYTFTREMYIGPPMTALPTGPDAYGYLALESDDPGGQPFAWIEITPPAGPGTALAFTQDDQTFTVDLPFAFQYYGLDYGQVSICANGWVALGATTDTDYSNSSIPDADGPPAMLAPFWEDLSPQQSGTVSHYYDSAEHRFVVEFYRVRQYTPATAFETFEVVLYDPAHHPTVTGDGKILFQWLDLSDLSGATFGIENHAEAVGLELGQDNSFAPTTAGIHDSTAVLFVPPAQAFPVAVNLTPAGTPIVIPAAGGSFNYTLVLSPPPGNPATLDVWVDVVLPNGSLYGPVLQRTVTLPAGQGQSRAMTQAVPGGAPEGDYQYRAFTGDYDLGVVWSTDQFSFTKSGADGSSSGSWACSEAEPGAAFGAAAPAAFALCQAHPNPFNPETAVGYRLPAPGLVSLRVFDTAGRVVATLLDGWREAGAHEVTFDASGLPSGIYFVRLAAGEASQVQKVVLLK
ncbi:MAG: T9SS C-terminal target domain-containing protein [Candidatus Zixiibacteriota bacterium]|nr:MAG: T9SS C-terminal target domain-containing protein [candidate division Zixibacteria bacterium]